MIVNRRPLASEGVRLQFKADEAGMGLLREAASSNKCLSRDRSKRGLALE